MWKLLLRVGGMYHPLFRKCKSLQAPYLPNVSQTSLYLTREAVGTLLEGAVIRLVGDLAVLEGVDHLPEGSLQKIYLVFG